MFGFEIEPLKLISEIIEVIRKKGKNLSFQKFKGLEDIESQVKEILNEN